MNTRIFSGLVIASLMMLMITACSGGSVNNQFNRFAAQALDSYGNPITGASVLVNGSNTGITSDSQGRFMIEPTHFSKGLSSMNRVSIGEKGIILATKELVPVENQNVIFQFPKAEGPTGSIIGFVFDDYNTVPLNEVRLTLFNEDLGLFQTSSQTEGYFYFADVPQGNYQLSAQKDGYNHGICAVQVQAGSETYQGITLQPIDKARFEDGIIVSGQILNSDTLEPVAGVNVNMTVDTGFIGMPEPWMGGPETPLKDGEMPVGGTGSAGSGMEYADGFAPPRYDPQYQETTTNDQGYFAFEAPAVGYAIYLNYSKDDFLGGSEYYDINGMTEDLVVSLKIKPLVMTSATGKVVDGNGQPIKGAYVEYVFAGEEIKYYDDTTTGGGGTPLGLPNDPGWDGFSGAVEETKGSGGALPPSAPPGMDMGGPGNDSGSPFDNPLMQRYRWENQNGREGAAAEGGFTGYYSTTTNDLGEFTFSELPVGAYYFFVSAYKHQSVNGDLKIEVDPANNYKEFTLAEIPVGSVIGVVKDENGMIIADSLVNCVQPYVDPFDYTNENGEFRIDNVPVGNWIVSAFKYGYLTDSKDVYIGENEEVTVNLTIQTYTPPAVDTVYFSGRVIDSSTGEGIEGARMIFTTSDNQFFTDVTSGAGGYYSAQLIPTEYNVLIQQSEYQDVYMRFYVDSLYPQYDFSMWSIYGGSGPWGGIMPGGIDGGSGGSMPPATPPDFAGGGTGGSEGGPTTPFDPNQYFEDRR